MVAVRSGLVSPGEDVSRHDLDHMRVVVAEPEVDVVADFEADGTTHPLGGIATCRALVILCGLCD